MSDEIGRAVALIGEADALLVTAGAGMGVDSGLPDFRSDNGFWRSYPALGRAGIAFEAIANPAAFLQDPGLAWGFYGHRLNLYRRIEPHAGFAVLAAIGGRLEHGAFVYTSNVDGQFQKAGFAENRIEEIHGSIHHLQCMNASCPAGIWEARDFAPQIDEAACRLVSEPPSCRRCGGLARPNILMFGDWSWCARRAELQSARLQAWFEEVRRPVVIEIGAGTDIPSVRRFGDRFERLIRINPREPQVARARSVGIAAGGLATLAEIARRLGLA